MHLADVLGLPRSIGELYGGLYAADRPLAMDELMGRLGLSKGATSQGLRLLRGFGAVRTVYIPGDRRDHYVAETELRRLVSGFLKERIQPHMENGADRLERMRELLDAGGEGANPLLRERIERLARWRKRGTRLLPLVLRLVERDGR